jgi:hypothetical protein
MKPETRNNLIKESEKIKQINSRSSYLGAWSGFILDALLDDKSGSGQNI